jgi:methionyl-tRNA synthetase
MIIRYRDGVVPSVPTDAGLARDFEALPERVADLFDRADVTQALELIWQRVRRLNRYVEERTPWQLAKDPADAAALDETLASLAEGLRVVSVLLHPFMPASVDKLLAAIGAPSVAFEGATFASHGSRTQVTALEPLFPKRA